MGFFWFVLLLILIGYSGISLQRMISKCMLMFWRSRVTLFSMLAIGTMLSLLTLLQGLFFYPYFLIQLIKSVFFIWFCWCTLFFLFILLLPFFFFVCEASLAMLKGWDLVPKLLLQLRLLLQNRCAYTSFLYLVTSCLWILVFSVQLY